MAKRDHDEPAAPVEQESHQQERATTFTVAKLAVMHGQAHATTVADDSPFKADHLVASTRHGWLKHEHDTGTPVMLSEHDYLAAIDAARQGKVHAPANKRGR